MLDFCLLRRNIDSWTYFLAVTCGPLEDSIRLEPERAPSTVAHSNLWSWAFLGFLIAVLPFATSKRNSERKTPAPSITTTPANLLDVERKHRTPLWEKLAVFIALALLIVNIFQTRATQKSANAST